MNLLFHDLQDLHGAGLDTNAAGDALSGGALSGSDHNLHGADLNALAAGSAELLVDHVNTGLGVLGDCTGLTDLGALAALDASHGLSAGTLGNDADSGQIFVEFLIEGVGASTDALQASHALGTLLNHQFLHKRNLLFPILQRLLYSTRTEIAMVNSAKITEYPIFSWLIL